MSFGLGLRAMRKILRDGGLGAVRGMQISAYTDWLLRPRTTEELVSVEQGGGIVHRQAPHQIDAVRLLGGGLLKEVRAHVGTWMPQRPLQSYYHAFLEFEDGTPATIIHDGNGYFMLSEFFPWAAERWRYTDMDRITMRQHIRDGARNDAAEKDEYRIGGRNDPTTKNDLETWEKPWVPGDLGLTLVTCERGLLRDARFGISVYDEMGKTEVDLRYHPHWDDPMRGALVRPSLEELYDAVSGQRPAYHTGAWGRATLEAVLAIVESGNTGKTIRLHRQIAMPTDYDATLDLNARKPHAPARFQP
jgi:phthalate 4,5-cis-dihydrodiol dehydrogenase